MSDRPTVYAWLPWPKGRLVRLRFRTANAVRDTWDRYVHGICCAMPSGIPTSPGYHFWRCGRGKGHDGAHRTVNYLWAEEGQSGESVYSPVDNPPPPLDRYPVRTRRQRRAIDAWHKARDAERRRTP